jgi:hypothetical protein
LVFLVKVCGKTVDAREEQNEGECSDVKNEFIKPADGDYFMGSLGNDMVLDL